MGAAVEVGRVTAGGVGVGYFWVVYSVCLNLGGKGGLEGGVSGTGSLEEFIYQVRLWRINLFSPRVSTIGGSSGALGAIITHFPPCSPYGRGNGTAFIGDILRARLTVGPGSSPT